MSTYPYRDAGPFEESGGVVVLDDSVLGYQPDVVFRVHMFQVVHLDGGKVELEGRGPAGTWFKLASNLAEDDVHIVNVGAWSAFRLTFSGTSGAGRVHVRSLQDGL